VPQPIPMIKKPKIKKPVSKKRRSYWAAEMNYQMKLARKIRDMTSEDN
jgi:hypothetical protein